MRFLRTTFLLFTLGLSSQGQAVLHYTPVNFDAAKARVLVVVHGCLQSAESMVLGTGWNQIADKENLLVIYPQVPEGSNPLGCWSWYLPENQRADRGQLRGVVDQVNEVKQLYKVADNGQFAVGISSGGATVAGLLACFPKEFSAGAIHSAPSYGLAQTLMDGEQVLKNGPQGPTRGPCRPSDFSGDVLVIQGAEDTVVNPKNAQRVIQDFLGTSTPAATRENRDSKGNLVSTEADYVQNQTRGRLVSLAGLGHVWAGYTQTLRYASLVGPQGKFPTEVPFFSEKGPSSTQLMWEFFAGVRRSPAQAAPQKNSR